MIEATQLATFLTARFGLGVQAEGVKSPDGHIYRIRPEGIAPTSGFTLDVVVGWRSVTASFVPGTFAAELVRAMEKAHPDQIAVFSVFVKNAAAQGAEVRMQVNDVPVDVGTPAQWPSHWRSVRFDFRKGALVLDPGSVAYCDPVLPWAARFFGTVLSLLPVEPTEEDTFPKGEKEGRCIEARAKRYERSHMNRAACIELHGLTCKTCAMSFSERYREVGAGFIHVHHLEPLSTMGEAYVINPATDLVPVCPNCHAMLHRRRPPYTPDELKAILCESPPP